jgi:hypothetical protein
LLRFAKDCSTTPPHTLPPQLFGAELRCVSQSAHLFCVLHRIFWIFSGCVSADGPATTTILPTASTEQKPVQVTGKTPLLSAREAQKKLAAESGTTPKTEISVKKATPKPEPKAEPEEEPKPEPVTEPKIQPKVAKPATTVYVLDFVVCAKFHCSHLSTRCSGTS